MDKVSYLEQENQELRGELSDLKELLKMNKIQIDVLSSQFESPETKKFIDILYKNRQLQQKLQEKLTASYREIKDLIAQNFMLKQMNEQQNHQMKAIEILNINSIHSLQACIKQLEEKITTMEKFHKEYDKVSGFVLKNRNIVVPAQMTMEMKEKQAEVNQQLALMTAELELAKKKQENLLIVNTVLRNKIVSLQAKLAMPNKNLGEVLDRSLKRLMVYFLEVQKKIVTGDDDSESDQQEDIQLIAPQLSGIFPEKQLRIQRDYGVPHLDLLKIRDQMIQGNSKIKDALAARNHLTDKEKVQRLEIELEYTRRELSRNIIDLKLESDRRKIAERSVEELQTRNFLLVNSNSHLQQKVRKYWDKLQSFLKNKEISGEVEEIFTDLQSTLVPPQLINKIPRKKQVEFHLDEEMNYKVFLELMAKELEQNKKLNNLEKMKKGSSEEPPKMKRSTSNPLLYFNERKNEIMEIKNEDELKHDDRHRMEQTCYQAMNDGEFDEDLDGFDI